jgi:archaellum biogenesis ATPase FlaH|tara:strand:+ start:2733 stop:4580 length:1848 start_codon:yes stop_codon:yes gene_type:complete
MILIPPYCHKDTPSSEKKVFNALKHDSNLITKNWIVYHSLNYPVSISKTKRSSFLYFGESDFLILAENIGIINIEVKGGSITCLDGIWQLKSRYETKNLSKSPIKQAHDTKYNIQEYIRKKFNRVYPQEYLVIFPDCSLTNIVDNIEYSENNIIDADQFYNNFSQRIFNLVKDLKPGGNIVNLENNEINKLKKIIRPDFETYIKTSTILKDSEDEISQYTKDQLKVLERIEHEPRLLVTGSQGTGKTVMAEEIIKRFANTGKKILFINSGRLANLLTKFKYRDDYKNINFSTFNNFVRDINKHFNNNISNLSKNFIEANNFLTKEALQLLNKTTDDKYLYDFIIIDEIQHCYFYDSFYLLLDKILKKGLLEGNYYFFGDFDYQNIIGEKLDKNILKNRMPKEHLQSYEQIMLWHNVRNSEDIAFEAPVISGLIEELPLPYTVTKTPGKTKHLFCKDDDDKKDNLLNILKKLSLDNVSGNDIVILSNYTLANNKNILNSIDVSQYYNIYDLSKMSNDGVLNNDKNKIKNKDTIYFSTTLAFQGLESKIVIYLDPLDTFYQSSSNADERTTNEAHMLLFNAMGRANTFLYLLWDKTFETWYEKRLRLLGNLMAKNEN